MSRLSPTEVARMSPARAKRLLPTTTSKQETLMTKLKNNTEVLLALLKNAAETK